MYFVKVYVTYKESVLDPQGEAVQGRFGRRQCQNKLRRPRQNAEALFAAKAGMHSRFPVMLSPKGIDNALSYPPLLLFNPVVSCVPSLYSLYSC